MYSGYSGYIYLFWNFFCIQNMYINICIHFVNIATYLKVSEIHILIMYTCRHVYIIGTGVHNVYIVTLFVQTKIWNRCS